MLIQLPAVHGMKSATVRRWLKEIGAAVAAGETVVELEGDEALLQLQASASGVLTKITAAVGKTYKTTQVRALYIQLLIVLQEGYFSEFHPLDEAKI